MTENCFEEGDFVVHRVPEKGYGFVVRKGHGNGKYRTVHVWHPTSSSNPRRDVTVFLSPADREPTEDEWVAFVKWRLTQ